MIPKYTFDILFFFKYTSAIQITEQLQNFYLLLKYITWPQGLRVPFQVKWKSVNRLHTLICYRLYVVYVNTLHKIRYLHLFITITKINFLIYIIYLFTRPKDWEKECQKWAKIWLPSRFYELLHSQRCIFFIFFYWNAANLIWKQKDTCIFLLFEYFLDNLLLIIFV